MHAPFEETEGDLQGDIREVDQNFKIAEEDAGFRPLEHSGIVEGADVSGVKEEEPIR